MKRAEPDPINGRECNKIGSHDHLIGPRPLIRARGRPEIHVCHAGSEKSYRSHQHMFHKICIAKWEESVPDREGNFLCPICRQPCQWPSRDFRANAYQKLQESSRFGRYDYKSVLEAVKSEGMALEHASRTLQQNKEIVRAAVEKSPYAALQYASRELKADKDIVGPGP